MRAAAGPGAEGPREAGHEVPRWDQHPRSPEGCRCASQEDTSEQRAEREALGRFRGGFGTKACVITDAIGRAVAFVLAPGQNHELPHGIPLLDKLPGVPKWVVADRGYSSHAFREDVWSLGARPVIPTRRERGNAVLSTLDLHESQSGRAAMGEAERVACARNPPRKDRTLLYRSPLFCRHLRLDQKLESWHSKTWCKNAAVIRSGSDTEFLQRSIFWAIVERHCFFFSIKLDNDVHTRF